MRMGPADVSIVNYSINFKLIRVTTIPQHICGIIILLSTFQSKKTIILKDSVYTGGGGAASLCG